MRAFIGIEFGTEVKREIYELQQRLRRYSQKGRWKHSSNFHLTLKFLDEIDSSQKAKIDEVLRQICTGRKPFGLNIKDLGIFSGRDSIRVLWLGLDGQIRELESLQKEIDNVLVPLGFEPEKRIYTPHVTIGQDIIFESGFEHIRSEIGQIGFSPIMVDKVLLFKSEQVQNKRIYSVVSEYILNKHE